MVRQGALAYVNNAMLLFATRLLGYAAAAAAVLLHSWHLIAYNNEIMEARHKLLLSRRRLDNCHITNFVHKLVVFDCDE